MHALKSSTDDHRLIAALLGALHTYATRLRAGVRVDPGDLARFAELLRELVDYRHHEKEEGILFPLLARNGFDWSDGLLAELRREHGQLRYLLEVLCQAAAKDAAAREAAADREPGLSLSGYEARRQVAEAALAFVEFKRRHLEKEERLLVPAIQQRLDARALDRLGVELTQFDEVLARQAGSGSLAEQAAELIRRHAEDSATLDVSAVEWTVVPVEARSLRRVS